jgi:hypothetical protein
MTEGRRRCNSGEGVLDHFDPAQTVDQSKIDPDIGQEPARFTAKEFLDCLKDAGNLRVRDVRGGEIMGLAVLYFDNDDPVTVPSDEIDLATAAAPVPGRDWNPAIFIVARNRGFGCVASKMISQAMFRPTAPSR